VRPGDILIARAGSVGKSFLIEQAERAVFASYLIRYRPKVVPRYVHYWLQTDAYWSQIVDNTAGIAVPNVNASKLDRISIPIPEPDIQRRIVERIDELFSELDDGEEELRRARAELETYRKSLLKAAVTGDLTADWRAGNPGQESAERLRERIVVDRRSRWDAEPRNKGKKYKPPADGRTALEITLPEGWIWASLDQVCERITDGTHQPPKFVSEGVPFLVIRNVVGGKINWPSVGKWVSRDTYLRETARLRPSKGDVLYTAVGSYGVALEVAEDREFMFQRHIAHLRPLPSAIHQRFLAYVLNSSLGRRQADLAARGVAQKTVTLGDLARFAIPVPPNAEQQVICSRLADVDQSGPLSSECQEIHGISQILRQSILAAAFRGDLVQ